MGLLAELVGASICGGDVKAAELGDFVIAGGSLAEQLERDITAQEDFGRTRTIWMNTHTHNVAAFGASSPPVSKIRGSSARSDSRWGAILENAEGESDVLASHMGSVK